MADTAYNGLYFITSNNIPAPPAVGYVRLYALLDYSIWQIDSDGVKTKLTN